MIPVIINLIMVAINVAAYWLGHNPINLIAVIFCSACAGYCFALRP